MHAIDPVRSPIARLQLFLALVMVVVLPQVVRAEKYLTAMEAVKQAFPAADRFEEKVVKFSPADRKLIGARVGGGNIPNLGNRTVLAWQGTNFVGLLVVDHVLGKHEIIDYAVAVEPDGRVHQIDILEFRESHGFEVRSPKWREQFKGKTAGSKFRLNDDIYNLSGATISCRQITEGVRRVLASYDLVLRSRLGLPGGLPVTAGR